MVKNYKKGKLQVEAIHFTNDNFDFIEHFTDGQAFNFSKEDRIVGQKFCYLRTPNGSKAVVVGSVFVKDADGKIYAWNPDLFKTQFKEV